MGATRVQSGIYLRHTFSTDRQAPHPTVDDFEFRIDTFLRAMDVAFSAR